MPSASGEPNVPEIKAPSLPMIPPPPEYTKRELRDATYANEVCKFRYLWKYHRDQGLLMDD